MWRRCGVSITLILAVVSAWAVTQEGLTRTIARQGQPGVPLDGVVVRVRGSHNAVQSHDNGIFSILLHNLQNGEPYTISGVIKAGYVPAEQELIGRRIPCSDQVPLELLMVSAAQLQADKEAIAAKARENVEIYYQNRLSDLEQQLAAKQLTEQEFSRRLDELESQYERFEPLLQTMSDKLARTDYSRMDSLTARIQTAIENGDAEEAERLVREKGDMEAREAAIREQEMQIARAQQTLDEAQARLDQQRALTQQQKRELADDYYRMYASFLSRFQNDSARYYIEKRAALDTTNVYYQLHAGQFVRDVMADMPRALFYFERAYRIALAQYGDPSEPLATVCNELGSISKSKKDYDQALEWFNRSLTLKQQLKGKETKAAAETLNNIGEIYRVKNDLKHAMEYHQQALKIREKVCGKSSLEVAESINNIGCLYSQQKQFAKAEKLFLQVRDIFAADPKTPLVRKADNGVNLGVAAYYLEHYPEAVTELEQALATYTKVLGKAHPKTRNAQACLQAARKKTENQ